MKPRTEHKQRMRRLFDRLENKPIVKDMQNNKRRYKHLPQKRLRLWIKIVLRHQEKD